MAENVKQIRVHDNTIMNKDLSQLIKIKETSQFTLQL